MTEKPWAEIDEDWKRKEERALAQRAANAAAAREGRLLPHPSPWDTLDPTKVSPDASPEEIHRSYLEFCRRCPPVRPKRHTI